MLDDNAGERMVPEVSNGPTFWEHIYRYAFASQFVVGKRVLDVACGEGYGAAACQRAGATHVIGVDISEEVCLHARNKYGVDARRGSAERIPVDDASVDVVISFETIEHVTNPIGFLDEIVRVLAPGGILLISTPDKEVYTGWLGTQNRHHCSEMTEEEFASVLRGRFHSTRFYTQRLISAVWWSPRTLVCESTPWGRIRGFGRLRRAVQRLICPEAVSEPTGEQRSCAVDVILKAARGRGHLLNPFLVRPLGRFQREKSVYMVASAFPRELGHL